MRRNLLLSLGVALLVAAPALKAYAQSQNEDDQRRQAQAEEDAKKKKKDKEWKLDQAPLPSLKNAGPCPFVRTLYDASRYVELKGDQETAANVGYTGEIEAVKATCAYKGTEPIHVSMAIDFAFGRGPQAQFLTKQYRYWVAVTLRNEAVLDKSYFDVPAVFTKGQDRVTYIDHIQDIVIPRARGTVSGSNFEVLIGFDVTPQMADFNRLGKRFRVNAEVEKTAANPSESGPPASQ